LLPAPQGGIAAPGRFFLAKHPASRAGLLRIGDLTVRLGKWDAKRLPNRQVDLRPNHPAFDFGLVDLNRVADEVIIKFRGRHLVHRSFLLVKYRHRPDLIPLEISRKILYFK
jgi:hypothetical protein